MHTEHHTAPRSLLLAAVIAAALLVASAAFAAPIAGPDDLAGRALAVQRGTTGQFIAEDILGDNAGALLTTYERYADAVSALRSGKVEAIVMDEAPARRFVETTEGLVILPEPLAEESYAIGFKKGSELRVQVDEALAAMKSEGMIDAIIKKYSGGDAELPDPSTIDLNKGASGGELIVGTEPGFAPYELKVGDGYVGIDIEIMAEVARRLGRTLVIESMNFDALPMAVSTGKVDAIAAGLTVTEERKQNMDFSINYIEGTKQVALIRAEDLAK